MLNFTLQNFPPLISSILFLLMGWLVFKKNKKAKINIFFLLICLVTFWWQFSWSILFSISDITLISILVRMGHIGIIFIPILFYHFFLIYFGKNKQLKEKIILFILYTLGLFFIFLLFFGNLFINGYNSFLWGNYPKAGILHPVFLFVIFSLAIRIIFLTLKELKYWRKLSPIRYGQIKYVLFALFFYIFSSLDFLINYGIDFYPIGFLFILGFLGIFAYTIIAYRLMDIKVVMRRYAVYLSSLAAIIAFALSAHYLVLFLFPKIINFADVLILTAAVSIFPIIKNYFYNTANKYFFSSLYDSKKVIAELGKKLKQTLDAQKIYEDIFATLQDALHFKKFGILSHDEKKESYIVSYNRNFNVNVNDKFLGDKKLHNFFITQNKSIVVRELKDNDFSEKNSELFKLLKKLNVAILTPLIIKNRIVGLIALGEKESGDLYNDEDLQMLKIISSQSAIAIENAMLYEETKNFNLKLQEEVKKATKDLVAANQKLEKLDEAKSEFISIASHQLRTPLTIIKGYISMMLEGSFGKLTLGETESLNKVYESNERLISLVENLLSISRIESGRLQFNYDMVQMEDLVASVYEELEKKALDKKLKFKYNKPKKKLAPLKIDEEKIRQVIMNLTDNAIKYTPKGSVTITLEAVENGRFIEFRIKDSGMGISETDIGNLFKKFSRGTGSALVHTEGTGLGLYVARQMIEAHGGKVWAESKGEKHGSLFCFRLPMGGGEK